ncbi:MAG: MFS transporter [Acidilobus sp.]
MSRWASLLGVLIPFMLSAYAVFSISLAADQLSASLRVPKALVLVAIPVDFIGGAIGGVAIGYLADRAGRRAALYVAEAVFSVAVALASQLRGLAQLYAAWFFVGFGVNAQNGVSYPVVVELLRSSRGLVGGIMQGLYFIGFFLDALTFQLVPHWRTYFLVVGLVSLILTVALNSLVAETAARSYRGLGLRAFDRRLALLTAGLSAISVGAFMFTIPLLSVVPSFITSMGLSRSWVEPLSIVGFIGFIVAGWASDVAGRLKTALAFIAVSLASAAALVVLARGYAGLAALSLMFFASGYFSFLGVWASETYPAELRATGTNVVFLVARVVGGFSTAIAAFIYPPSLRVGTALTGIIAGAIALAGAATFYLAARPAPAARPPR